MAAHLYWAVRAAGRSSVVSIAELVLRSSPGGANQATGGTAGAQNTSIGVAAANAFDGNASTFWQWGSSPSTGTRLWYQFAAPVDIVEMAVTMPVMGTSGLPGATWVEWSDDGVTWSFGTGAVDLSSFGPGETATFAVSDAAPTARLSGLTLPRLIGYSATAEGRLAGGLSLVARPADDGPGRIAGTVANDGTPVVPVRRRVRLFDQQTARLVREVWSEAGTGAFEFAGLALRPYLVVTDDHTRLYDPVARAEVVPA